MSSNRKCNLTSDFFHNSIVHSYTYMESVRILWWNINYIFVLTLRALDKISVNKSRGNVRLVLTLCILVSIVIKNICTHWTAVFLKTYILHFSWWYAWRQHKVHISKWNASHFLLPVFFMIVTMAMRIKYSFQMMPSYLQRPCLQIWQCNYIHVAVERCNATLTSWIVHNENEKE